MEWMEILTFALVIEKQSIKPLKRKRDMKAFEMMVAEIKNAVANDLMSMEEEGALLKLVLNAYNTYQEDERNGVDYIFDLTNQDDLKCVVNGGMTAKEIGELYMGSQVNHSQYFLFGCNYTKAVPIANWETRRERIMGFLDEVIEKVVTFPYIKGYRELYEKYVTEKVNC